VVKGERVGKRDYDLDNHHQDNRPEMIEIRLQGRGGQGVVVASEILARACFENGMFPQCYSLFGGERRGAPVAAFVRVSDRKIYLKCDITRPNHLILFDPTLMEKKELATQMAPGGLLLLNGNREFDWDGLEAYRVGTIDALAIARRRQLESIVNTAILGAYIRVSQITSLNLLLKVIEETVPSAVAQNLAAARDGYEMASIREKEIGKQ